MAEPIAIDLGSRVVQNWLGFTGEEVYHAVAHGFEVVCEGAAAPIVRIEALERKRACHSIADGCPLAAASESPHACAGVCCGAVSPWPLEPLDWGRTRAITM